MIQNRVIIFAYGFLAVPYILPAQANSADRVALTNPANPMAAMRAPFVPMTNEERFHRYIKDTLSPTAFVSAGAAAGIGQWRDRPKPWGEGAEGYGRRFASAYLEHVERETLLFGLSTGLHEDNRYIASGRAGTRARIGYAVESTFLARRDDGSRRVSISKLVAFTGAAAFSRAWQPTGYGTVRSGAVNLGTSFSVAVGFNVAREFLPRLFH